MTYTRQSNTFTDPNGVYTTYVWPINHETEEMVQNSRQMGDGAATTDIGLVPQQGAPFPLVFLWKGKIFTQADKSLMDAWYGLCQWQSIYLTDFSGSKYEGIITDWHTQRVPVAWQRRGNLPWYWQYEFTFRVFTVISGDWIAL